MKSDYLIDDIEEDVTDTDSISESLSSPNDSLIDEDLDATGDFTTSTESVVGLFNSILQNRKELFYKPDEFFFQHNTDKLENIICNRIVYLVFNTFENNSFNFNNIKYDKTYILKSIMDITLKFLTDLFTESPLSDLYFYYKNTRCIDDFLTKNLNNIKKGKCNFFRGILRDNNYTNNKKDNILKLLDYAYMLNCPSCDYKDINVNYLSSILLGLVRLRLNRGHYIDLFSNFQKYFNDLNVLFKKVDSKTDFIEDTIKQLEDLSNLIDLYKTYLELIEGCFIRQIGTFTRRLCRHYKNLNLLDVFSIFYLKLKFAIFTFDANMGSLVSYVLGVFRNVELMISAKQKKVPQNKISIPFNIKVLLGVDYQKVEELRNVIKNNWSIFIQWYADRLNKNINTDIKNEDKTLDIKKIISDLKDITDIKRFIAFFEKYPSLTNIATILKSETLDLEISTSQPILNVPLDNTESRVVDSMIFRNFNAKISEYDHFIDDLAEFLEVKNEELINILKDNSECFPELLSLMELENYLQKRTA